MNLFFVISFVIHVFRMSALLLMTLFGVVQASFGTGCKDHNDAMWQYFGLDCAMVGPSSCNIDAVRTFCPVMCRACEDCLFCDQSYPHPDNLPPACTDDKYNCLEITEGCYNKTLKCSGYPECWDMSDEIFC